MTAHRPLRSVDETRADIARWLPLFVDPDDWFEVRAIHPERTSTINKNATYSPKTAGYWHHAAIDLMAARVAELNESSRNLGLPVGIYYTPHRLKPDATKSGPHGLMTVGKGMKLTHDLDVAARRFLIVDIDPFRNVAGTVSATDAEKGAALRISDQVRRYFEPWAWPAPVVVDSGNGYHLYYRLPEPLAGGAVDSASDPAARLLAGLARRYDTPEASIDTSVFNSSRIMRLPGTTARKGPATPDRPHRECRVLEPSTAKVNGGAAVIDLCNDLSPPGVIVSVPAGVPNGTDAAASSSAKIDPDGLPPWPVRVDRARKYLAKAKGGVQGAHGSNPTFTAARALVRGFLLDEQTALGLMLSDFNPKCSKPWSISELEHKLRDAATKPYGKPPGWMYQKREGGRPMTTATSKSDAVTAPAPETTTAGRKPGGIAPDGQDRRPKVVVSTDESITNDFAILTLADDPEIYQRAGMLVRVIQEPASDAEAMIRRPAGPRIADLAHATLRERLTKYARFVKLNESETGPPDFPVSPPDWCVKAIHARGEWDRIRVLNSVVDHPVLRPDGTILSATGYDPTTRLFVWSDVTPVMPPDTTAARDLLLDLVSDFPFKAECHKSAWMAALLTPLARFAFPGPAPLFLFDANVPGAGKGLLSNIIGLTVTGKNFPTTPYAHDNDEMRKQITSIALAGDRMVLLDNIDGRLGNANLCAALTTDVWKDRILGENRGVCVPLFAIWYATGNNVQLGKDMPRRVCHVRLESPLERPEERSDLRHPDLRKWIAANRPRLIGAGLAILSGYTAAGRPDQKLTPFGDSGGWSKLVRSAVVWAGLPDPLEGSAELRANASGDTNAFSTLLAEWEKIDPDGEGLTTEKIIERTFAGTGPEWEEIRSAVEELAPKRDAKKLGNVIRSKRTRPFAGRRIDRLGGKTKKSARWLVYGSDNEPVRRVTQPQSLWDDDRVPHERAEANTSNTAIPSLLLRHGEAVL